MEFVVEAPGHMAENVADILVKCMVAGGKPFCPNVFLGADVSRTNRHIKPFSIWRDLSDPLPLTIAEIGDSSEVIDGIFYNLINGGQYKLTKEEITEYEQTVTDNGVLPNHWLH